ncbi:MAG: hypothetical protein DSZ32_05610 [Gammaproteobacteria bacterium]|nr:MAG: hypothetical protein DSZ32_05610 [Gammaproteobacteria bacterium]RTZ59565.1 MAG: hypothetical protein DSZ33_04200 [Gammaproteobacteria bacterium]
MVLVLAIGYQTIQNRRAAEDFAQWQESQRLKQAAEESERLAREQAYQRQRQAQIQKQEQLARKMRELRALESRKRLSKIEEHAGDREFLEYLAHKDEIEAEKALAVKEENLKKRMNTAIGAMLKSAEEAGIVMPPESDLPGAVSSNVTSSRPAHALVTAPNEDAIRAAEAFARQFGKTGSAALPYTKQYTKQ